MTWDEAKDFTVEPEIIEADQIDPEDAGDPERPLTPEELEDLYRSDPRNGADFDSTSEDERFALYLDSLDKNRKDN